MYYSKNFSYIHSKNPGSILAESMAEIMAILWTIKLARFLTRFSLIYIKNLAYSNILPNIMAVVLLSLKIENWFLVKITAYFAEVLLYVLYRLLVAGIYRHGYHNKIITIQSSILWFVSGYVSQYSIALVWEVEISTSVFSTKTSTLSWAKAHNFQNPELKIFKI